MIKVSQGKRETWELAKKCGLDEKIALISKYFDIADVCVIGKGEMAYVNEKPRKVVRVPAVPVRVDSKAVIENTKSNWTKKRLK